MTFSNHAQNIVKNLPFGHRGRTLSGCALSLQLRYVSAIEKKLVKQQYLLHMPHNLANFGPLATEMGSRVWGTPASLNGFHVLASLLQRRRSLEANQTLHDIWPSPGLVHYICIFGCC